MNKRILIILITLAVVAGAIYGYREWNRGLEQANEVKAEVALTAEELFKAYTSDEAGANQKFTDKVVQVSGTVREVTGGNGSPVNVLLETGDPLGAVVCEFAADMTIELKSGAMATVKGFCTGYNLDVLLQRCAIVE